jgi:hypothetical protein
MKIGPLNPLFCFATRSPKSSHIYKSTKNRPSVSISDWKSFHPKALTLGCNKLHRQHAMFYLAHITEMAQDHPRKLLTMCCLKSRVAWWKDHPYYHNKKHVTLQNHKWKLRHVPPRMLLSCTSPNPARLIQVKIEIYTTKNVFVPLLPVQQGLLLRWRLTNSGAARSHTYFEFVYSDKNLCKSSHISNKYIWHCVKIGKFNSTKLRYELWWPLLTHAIKQHHGPCIPPQRLLYLALPHKHHSFIKEKTNFEQCFCWYWFVQWIKKERKKERKNLYCISWLRSHYKPVINAKIQQFVL